MNDEERHGYYGAVILACPRILLFDQILSNIVTTLKVSKEQSIN